MNTVLALLGLGLKSAGVMFLFAAALGVLRFRDPLQRMHAATKAGSIGAGLVILGALAAASDVETVVIGLLAILFLLSTAPVAGHLLGRAAYVSGAPLADFVGGDALVGVLPRQMQIVTRSGGDVVAKMSKPVAFAGATKAQPLTRIRFAVISPGGAEIALRAMHIAKATGLALDGYAVVDTVTAENTADPGAARLRIRGELDKAVAAVQALAVEQRVQLRLTTLEGVAEQTIPEIRSADHLLVLPQYGYFHHGVDLETPYQSGRPDGLLRIAALHRGPVLLTAGPQPTAIAKTKITVLDDGAERLPDAVAMAMAAQLWRNPHLNVITKGSSRRIELFRQAGALAGADVQVVAIRGSGSSIPLPASGSDCEAVVISELPRPLRTSWYGQEWLDHFGPDWAGDVLLASI